ncbi:MAG: sensor histidine kinase [Chloroflexi bacterium]|nr:sensor histidine kinase [Chloroflexota bacterium]
MVPDPARETPVNTPPHAVPAEAGVTLRQGRLSLAAQFLLASLIIMLASMLVIGTWVGQQIESGVVNRTAAIMALFVESVIEPYVEPLASQPRLEEAQVGPLDQLLAQTPLGERIVAFKVWSPEGEVLYSPNRLLIGRRFELESGLARALNGEVVAHMSDLHTAENEYERQRWGQLLEVYLPVRERGGGRIIAVTEFYQRPDELEGEIYAAQLRSWAVVALVTAATYLALAGIVRRGSDTIAAQQTTLREKVAELSRLLEQNARLHGRVRQAAGRTTTLKERALRRISADLHDGPGQALALALLRLDALESRCGVCSLARDDVSVVHGAVRDALDEVRSIAAGLRLPHLASLSVAEVAERAVRDHERRSETSVQTHFQHLPAQAPLPIKIALFRALQEALSNATRHGGGVGVAARVWAEAGGLYLAVSDRGPGFAPEHLVADGHLGLAGMREQAEVLGGSFHVDSQPGQGTTVYLRWPIAEAKG